MEKNKSISRWWLIVGVVALAIAGLYSLTLVIGRAPGLSDNAEIQRIFKDALVVHVDLSVLVWFLAIACMLWSMVTAGARTILPFEGAALVCFALAILFMMLSPFDPQAVAYMSNYIPTISSPVFLLGLCFGFCGVCFMLLKLFTSCLEGYDAPLRFGILSAGWITAIAFLCFYWSYRLMPPVIEGEQYFDLLFWGGGHVLQFTHTQVLMVVWLLLAAVLMPEKKLHTKLLYALFVVGLLAALSSPVAYFLYDVTSAEFRAFFTYMMIAANGLAPGILALILVVWLWRFRALRKSGQRALWSCASVSALLFLYGGFLAMLIQGQNVMIPAHYHGSIVGITLAFMGFAYMMLPRFGYLDVANWRMAYWQPIVYGVGQVMHVSGLAYSGGYGVLRKTAGGVDNLAPNIKVALGVMGLGGVLAIAGGLLFVIVIYKSLKNNNTK
jgi:cytochrome c oxidase subunit 1